MTVARTSDTETACGHKARQLESHHTIYQKLQSDWERGTRAYAIPGFSLVMSGITIIASERTNRASCAQRAGGGKTNGVCVDPMLDMSRSWQMVTSQICMQPRGSVCAIATIYKLPGCCWLSRILHGGLHWPRKWIAN